MSVYGTSKTIFLWLLVVGTLFFGSVLGTWYVDYLADGDERVTDLQ
jgi:hypothetical protein